MLQPELESTVPIAAESQDGDAVIVGNAEATAPDAASSEPAAPGDAEDGPALTPPASETRNAFILGVVLGLALAFVVWWLSRAGGLSPWAQRALFRRYFELQHDVQEYGHRATSTCRVELRVPGWDVARHNRWIKAAVAVE